MCKLNDLRVKHLTLEKVICTISTKLGMVDILNGERREGKIKTRMLGKDRGNNEGKKKKRWANWSINEVVWRVGDKAIG